MESRARSGEDCQLLTTPSQCGARCFLDPALDDSTSIVAITFRRRFRVPRCKENNLFPAGKGCSISVELKLLVALRILGRDAVESIWWKIP